MSRWVVEDLHGNFRISLEAKDILHETKTEHQHLVLFENPTFGRVLALDSVMQTTEKDEFIYHEMLAHVPILAHGAAKRVLIIGGGDGGMLEEVLKHQSIETATMVEIDPTVIELSKTHLRSICGQAFEDPRCDLLIADGIAFMKEPGEGYDVIIIDSTDPIGPGEVLFTEDFYASCRNRLNPGGIVVTQNGVPFLQGPELTSTLKSLTKNFADATAFLATVPTYVGGPMAFGWASDDASHRQVPLEVLEARFTAAELSVEYYTPAVHQAAFALPRYILDLIS